MNSETRTTVGMIFSESEKKSKTYVSAPIIIQPKVKNTRLVIRIFTSPRTTLFILHLSFPFFSSSILHTFNLCTKGLRKRFLEYLSSSYVKNATSNIGGTIILSPLMTLSELDERIEKSVENSSRYLNDALFLFQHKRYESAILLSMLSYEESGKALSAMDSKMQKRRVTKSRWVKKFCSHTIKNLASRRAIRQNTGFTPHFPDWDKILSKFDREWKHVFTILETKNGLAL